jgi:hypothetical protein
VVFAIGVCFFWPTMLGFVNEKFPATGALGLAIMGGCGMLSVSIVLPIMGRYYDAGIATRMPGKSASELASAPVDIQAAAGLETLGKVAILPVILTVVFLLIYLSQRKKSGTPAAPAQTTAGV